MNERSENMVRGLAAPLKYFQGPDILESLFQYIRHTGNKFLILTDSFVFGIAGEKIQKSFGSAEEKYTFELFHGECTIAEARRVADAAGAQHCDCIVGAGGGKTIDTAKYAANLMGYPVIIIPTTAATDAPCSATAVMYDENGAFVASRKMRKNPDIVLVDTQVIAQAPVRTLVAGMGDAFSTYYEARACRESQADTFVKCKRSETGYALAELCDRLLLQYGREARKSAEDKRVSEALEVIVEANIYLSGVGFENNGCALAHAFCTGLTRVWNMPHLMHGEAVAVGTLVQLAAEYLHAGRWNETEWKRVTDFYKAVGLPMTLSALGIEPDSELLHAMADETCALPIAKNMPFAVASEMLLQAVQILQERLS